MHPIPMGISADSLGCVEYLYPYPHLDYDPKWSFLLQYHLSDKYVKKLFVLDKNTWTL